MNHKRYPGILLVGHAHNRLDHVALGLLPANRCHRIIYPAPCVVISKEDATNLHNHIFSDDSTLLAPDYSAMTLLAVHPDNPVGKDLHTLVVFWMVGEKHGGRRIENSKPKADISNIFASLKPSGKTTST